VQFVETDVQPWQLVSQLEQVLFNTFAKVFEGHAFEDTQVFETLDRNVEFEHEVQVKELF